jgi:hypothetical protein
MGQITFKTGTITFKGATLSFKSNHFWTLIGTFSENSAGGQGEDYFFSGEADSDISTMIDIMEDIEPANNVPGYLAMFYDTDSTLYYLFVSTY